MIHHIAFLSFPSLKSKQVIMDPPFSSASPSLQIFLSEDFFFLWWSVVLLLYIPSISIKILSCKWHMKSLLHSWLVMVVCKLQPTKIYVVDFWCFTTLHLHLRVHVKSLISNGYSRVTLMVQSIILSPCWLFWTSDWIGRLGLKRSCKLMRMLGR